MWQHARNQHPVFPEGVPRSEETRGYLVPKELCFLSVWGLPEGLKTKGLPLHHLTQDPLNEQKWLSGGDSLKTWKDGSNHGHVEIREVKLRIDILGE